MAPCERRVITPRDMVLWSCSPEPWRRNKGQGPPFVFFLGGGKWWFSKQKYTGWTDETETKQVVKQKLVGILMDTPRETQASHPTMRASKMIKPIQWGRHKNGMATRPMAIASTTRNECGSRHHEDMIAHASLRIMRGHVYFSIRDCKTLHRDWSAIGSRLRQTFVVAESIIVRGENNIIYDIDIIWHDNHVTFQPYTVFGFA